jgi:hypothetical protein
LFLVIQVGTSTILLFREATNPPALEYSQQFYNALPHDVCAGQSFTYESALKITRAPVVFRLVRSIVTGRVIDGAKSRTIVPDKTPEWRNVLMTKTITSTVTYTTPTILAPGPYTLLVGVSSEGVRDAIYGVEFDIVEC